MNRPDWIKCSRMVSLLLQYKGTKQDKIPHNSCFQPLPESHSPNGVKVNCRREWTAWLCSLFWMPTLERTWPVDIELPSVLDHNLLNVVHRAHNQMITVRESP